MPSTVPENDRASARKIALNGSASPSGPMVESDQFVLGSADARCLEGASRIAVLAHDSARDNGFSLGTVAGLVGKDLSAVSRAFDTEDPHTVLRFFAAVILLDKSRTFLQGVARLAGGDFVDRPQLTPEQKLERLTDALKRHGKIGEAIIDEAWGQP